MIAVPHCPTLIYYLCSIKTCQKEELAPPLRTLFEVLCLSFTSTWRSFLFFLMLLCLCSGWRYLYPEPVPGRLQAVLELGGLQDDPTSPSLDTCVYYLFLIFQFYFVKYCSIRWLNLNHKKMSQNSSILLSGLQDLTVCVCVFPHMFISLWRAGVILLWVGFKVIVLLLSCPACRLVCVCVWGGGDTPSVLYTQTIVWHTHTQTNTFLSWPQTLLSALWRVISVYFIVVKPKQIFHSTKPESKTWLKHFTESNFKMCYLCYVLIHLTI